MKKIKKTFFYLLGFAFLLFAFTVIINLSVFDETLLPEVQAIKDIKAQPYGEDNAYPALIAINGESGRSMAQATKEIRDFLNQKIQKTGLDFLSTEEEQLLLGIGNDKSWQNQYKGCNSRTDINCMTVLLKSVTDKPIENTRLLEQFNRYADLIKIPAFYEATQISFDSPLIRYAPIMNIKRLYLIQSFIDQQSDDFLRTVYKDTQFWRMILDDSHLLITQMVALSSIRDDINILSMAMQQGAFSPLQLKQLKTNTKTLSKSELNMGKTYEFEFKGGIAFFDGSISQGGIGNAFENMFFQPEATLNINYAHVTEPLKNMSQLTTTEFYQYIKGNKHKEDFTPPFSWSPSTLYNPAGKILIGYAIPAYTDYNSRVHDLNGMFYLLKLQIEIALNPGQSVEQVIANSQYTNPYTLKPMSYNKDSHSIYFECMDKHSVCELSL